MSKISLRNTKDDEMFFKKLAFFSSFFAFISLIVATIIVPTPYIYLQRIHSSLETEFDFCLHRIEYLWKELDEVFF